MSWCLNRVDREFWEQWSMTLVDGAIVSAAAVNRAQHIPVTGWQEAKRIERIKDQCEPRRSGQPQSIPGLAGPVFLSREETN